MALWTAFFIVATVLTMSPALSAHNFSIVAEIGRTISETLNLTELGWHTDDIVRSVLAWNSTRHPIAKLENGSSHSECYDLSFLGLVRCTDVNITLVETNVVCIKMRLVTKAMAAKYIYYPFYSVINHNRSFVQISVHLKDTPDPTSAASYVTPVSSTHTPTKLPAGANRKTKDPVKNQGLRSDEKRTRDGSRLALYAFLAAVFITLVG